MTNPSIYHITHVTNLSSILAHDRLWSDHQRITQQLMSHNIGLNHIKARRLQRAVPVSQRGTLGEYVPFNFCPRSVMLFAICRGHNDYDGGQESVVHLVSDYQTVCATGRPWAFTDIHADLAYARYFDTEESLDQVNWTVMPLTYWSHCKEERQAEFLVHDWLPWSAIHTVGVQNDDIATQVRNIISQSSHQPRIEIHPEWYY